MAKANQDEPTVVGRYVLDGEVASGGMATVYHGRSLDEDPPGTTVAVKRVHPHLAKDKRFASMFIDEARLVSRIHHPNVIRTLDIIASDNECLLVMEYVHGCSLGRLLRLSEDQRVRPPVDILSAVVCGALEGLEASHNATNAAGVPLQMVHRDISPQNIMVGVDGRPRVLDFGVAKAAGSLHVTRDGEIKGKLAYMSPEQVGAKPVDRRTDVYATGVILWEAVTQLPLFDGENEAAIIASVMRQEIAVPSTIVQGLPAGLDEVIMRSLAADKDKRFASAREMAAALDAVVPRADFAKVAAWVDELAGAELRERYAAIQSRAAGVPLVPVAQPKRPVGVTEVFFHTGSGEQRAAEQKAAEQKAAEQKLGEPQPGDVAAKASQALLEKVASADETLRDATRFLPLQVQGPIAKLRWWIVGAGFTFFLALIIWAFKPVPPPAANIEAAPDMLPTH